MINYTLYGNYEHSVCKLKITNCFVRKCVCNYLTYEQSVCNKDGDEHAVCNFPKFKREGVVFTNGPFVTH